MSTLTRTIGEPIGDRRVYVDSFIRQLRAENASERTVQTHAEAAAQLDRLRQQRSCRSRQRAR